MNKKFVVEETKNGHRVEISYVVIPVLYQTDIRIDGEIVSPPNRLLQIGSVSAKDPKSYLEALFVGKEDVIIREDSQ